MSQILYECYGILLYYVNIQPGYCPVRMATLSGNLVPLPPNMIFFFCVAAAVTQQIELCKEGSDRDRPKKTLPDQCPLPP